MIDSEKSISSLACYFSCFYPEFYHDSPAMETDMVPETPAPAHLKFFNGVLGTWVCSSNFVAYAHFGLYSHILFPKFTLNQYVYWPFLISGKMSYIKGPKKLTTSIAYPFALIKPCGVHGDVTLKDINQRILAPLPSKSKLKKDEDPSISYPTSAFSGKPVVVKTKIRTEGGQGSITIMRTKGWVDIW